MMRKSMMGLCTMALLAVGGCVQQSICADFFANATITDVLHDEDEDVVYVSVIHSLSYCTGTDEKKFAIELIEIDLVAETAEFSHKTSNSRDLYGLPEVCCYIQRDINFHGGEDCAGCELVLHTRDGSHELRFVSDSTWDLPIQLTVSDGAAEVMTIDIDGYRSAMQE